MTVVTSSFMFPHLSDAQKQQVLCEVQRVLGPGGRFGCLTSQPRFGSIYPTETAWRSWLEATGFADMQVADHYDVYQIVTARISEEAP